MKFSQALFYSFISKYEAVLIKAEYTAMKVYEIWSFHNCGLLGCGTV
jgi:hypothetical protein